MSSNLEVSVIFPFNCTLCPTSPSLQWVAWVSLPHLHRYYCPSDGRRLRLPLPLLCVLCSRSVTDTLFVPSVRLPSSGSLTLRNPAPSPGLLGPPVRLFRLFHKETSGSPRFPGYPFDSMPRSPTPVVSSILALAYSGRLPSVRMKTSAFPFGCPLGYPLSTTIQISWLNHAACSLAYPGFGLPLPDLPAGFATSLLARLWLGGTCTQRIASPWGLGNFNEFL